jgi:hypothetical protein
MFGFSGKGRSSTKIYGSLAAFVIAFLTTLANAQQQSIETQPAKNTTNHRSIPDDNLGYPALITGPNFHWFRILFEH